MQKIGIIYNPTSDRTFHASLKLAHWLEDQGMLAWVGTSQSGRDEPELIGNCDLLVALGGDGTVLRTARLAIPHDIPILGVAMGHLSFMAEVSLDELPDSLLALRDGQGWFDDRALVEARVRRGSTELMHDLALNEMLLARTDMSRVVKVEVTVDGMPLTTYHADGVILASATGSTAYALAAGGPLLDPRSDALLLVPVAAHLTRVPTLVLPADARVTWRLASYYPAALSVDGQHFVAMEQGDEVELWRSNSRCRFARIHPRTHFYQTLTSRLQRS